MRQLVLVHGRSQQGKDSAGLKGEWLAALRTGLAASGLTTTSSPRATRPSPSRAKAAR